MPTRRSKKNQKKVRVFSVCKIVTISSQDSEETRDESSDIAEEVHKSLLVEERLFNISLLSTNPNMETEERVQGEEG